LEKLIGDNMSTFNGQFIAHDKHIFKDVEHGQMSPGMHNVYIMLLDQCEYETGIWWGSVPKLYEGWGGQISNKKLERDLSELYKKGYARSFRTEGKRGNYPVLIHGYKIRSGPRIGLVLEAHQSQNWNDAVYLTEEQFASKGTPFPFAESSPAPSPAPSPALSSAPSPPLSPSFLGVKSVEYSI
jgi:hypothetical protein